MTFYRDWQKIVRSMRYPLKRVIFYLRKSIFNDVLALYFLLGHEKYVLDIGLQYFFLQKKMNIVFILILTGARSGVLAR